MSKKERSIDDIAIAAIRGLIVDTINKANSGHPGMALDFTPALYALYRDHLVADPAHPEWQNRDRLVYSAGHASALIYSMLHVSGYDVTIDDLKSFRQLGSKTPGHPEVGVTPGVDATAGPLGQGIAQAVGMAIAERAIAAQYPEGSRICDHYTYCVMGDGCLQEGISQEAMSLAGHLKLNKLIVLYDENGSTLDGPTSQSFTENVELRAFADEWDVLKVKDGNNVEEISKAIAKAKKSPFPSIIIIKTKIGYGSKNEGSCKTHGSPLGEEDGAHAKGVYGVEWDPFTVPMAVYDHLRYTFVKRGQSAYEADLKALDAYRADHNSETALYFDAINRVTEHYLPAPLEALAKPEATRSSSGRFLLELYKTMPFTFGGSADVAGSTKTAIPSDPKFTYDHPEGRDVNWGIREFAMASAINGILLHRGLVAYGGLFLIFADYLKPAIRMAAIEHLPAIYVLTHDSIAVGEDGLTHEPIEQLAMLRSIPNVSLIRPADTKELDAAWRLALLSQKTPTALILTRQNLPLLENTSKEGVEKGAYCVYGPKEAELEILATGSEVSLAIEATKLVKGGEKVRVISMPDLSRFAAQDQKYRKSVLTLPKSKRVSLEMASTFGWDKYADHHIGIDVFGTSAPYEDIAKAYGFTPEEVAKKIQALLPKRNAKLK